MTNRTISLNLLTKPTITKFHARINRTNNESCWVWSGKKMFKRQYGLFYINGQWYLAHRVSFLLYNGHLNPIKVVRHTCDNPACVNPSHLIIGTQRDNVTDAVKKLRMQHGETHCRAKLKTKQVKQIQFLLKSGEMQKDIAKRFGVSSSTICCINIKRNWKHVN